VKGYGPLIAVLVMALLLAVPHLLSGHGRSTVKESAAPAEITFESTAPQYQPEVAAVSPGVPVHWLNSTASPHSIRHGMTWVGLVAVLMLKINPRALQLRS
jgi:plastocyanin